MGSLPDSKYIIKTDGYWFVEAHDVDPSKGYITVSAKGIVNGLSSIPNDGADFGPDTYNPSSTASIPYTYTSGIQEAINYIANNNGGKIRLLHGVYDVTDAPLIEDPNNPGHYAQIYIPYVPLNSVESSGLAITIESDWGQLWYITQLVGTPLSSTYIISNYEGTENVTVFYAMHGTVRGGQSAVSLTLPALVVFSYPKSNIGAIDISSAIHANGETLMAITTNMLNYTGLPTVYGGTGINLGIHGYGGTKVFQNVKTSGYNIGLIVNTHTSIQKYESYFANIGVQLENDVSPDNSAYMAQINYYDCQMTAIGINGISGKLTIGVLSYGDVETNTGYYFSYKYHVQVLSGNSAMIYIIQQTVNLTGISASSPFGTPTVTPVNNIVGIFNGKIVHSVPSLSPNITANPPASATAYQNTNPYDIIIYLPAYATASGTAGSVAVAIGSSSTPSTTFTQFVSGSTSSSSPDTIQIKVPAGWYYEVTTTGVTLATATVVAD